VSGQGFHALVIVGDEHSRHQVVDALGDLLALVVMAEHPGSLAEATQMCPSARS